MDEAKLIAYEDAHAVAVEMGYPSLTEALEHLAALRPQPGGSERNRLKRAIADGFSGGNEQYDDAARPSANAMTWRRMRF